jgi:hypothetical protein
MSKNMGNEVTRNGPTAPAQAEGEVSAEAGSASAHAEDVQEGRPAEEEERQRLIAVAAYYRAEHRAFAPGCELDDWVEAEAEIEQGRSSQSG